MKKLLFTTCFVSLLLVSCGSTDQARFGLKAGPNFSSIKGDDAESFKSKTAFHVGGVAEIPVSSNFSVQPELLYSSQGADYEDTDYSGKYKLDYLTVPVMVKFNISNGFSLEAGPQIGILLSAKDEYDSTEGGSGEDDVKDFTKNTDIGLNFGLGYRLESGLNFGARYNLGLTELNDFPESDGEKWKNGVIQFSVGYFFN